jgi:hypothetical protein
MGKTTEFCRSVHQAFPTDDPLALGLLRLMAGYNDLMALAQWSSADKELTGDDADRTVRIGHRFIKLRLIVSLFYEVLTALAEFEQEPEFKKLGLRLNQEGRDALKQLRMIRCGKDPTIRDLLDRTRNLATFHYLKAPFKEQLANMPPNHGSDCVFPVVIRHGGDDERRWYPLAEHLKIETAFELGKGVQALMDRLDYIVARLDDLACFLEDAFRVFKKIRKADTLFAIGTPKPRT